MEYSEQFFIGMGEYRNNYLVERQMHCRSWTEVAEVAGKISEKRGAYVFIKNSGSGREIVDAVSVMSLAANMIGHPIGSTIEIIVKGNKERNVLKECADEVARVFCKRD